ncbi:hypothetical protein [Bacillus sp. KH172YL63]|uniref:hypothetical protein n=1 Tax=Bacillus sp. KH172YL63 TaxID=2709784 RepID=UPI0013E4D5B6|nr:hypothetical protein [Bacillus sp. KH172YL63]BCB04871.1 hypothetical protein KH172YL63_30040 [Bacillus sp. KH172YL63]
MEPFIIIILISIISTIFNKMKESQKEKPVRQKPIQTATPKASPQTQREGRATTFSSREIKKPSKEGATSIQSLFEEKKKEAEMRVSLQKKEEEYARKLKAHQSRAKRIRETGSPLSIDFSNEDDIVKGFIFSEVIGPPRSKKPLHRK